MTRPVPTSERNRNRLLLLLIFVIFLGSAAAAVTLRLAGWQPQGRSHHGELIDPPGDLRQLAPQLADGSGGYRWQPSERIWRLLLAPPAGCVAVCVTLSADLDKVWQLQGRQADHVHILWMGDVPEGAVRNSALRVLADSPDLRAGLPQVDDPAGIPLYIIDPNGFVMMRYAPGVDPVHLREDLAKLLKLR